MNTLTQTPSAKAVIATFRAHEAKLCQVGLLSLSLFGSVGRGDGDAGSDVDPMGRLDPAAWIDLGGPDRTGEASRTAAGSTG